MKFRHLLTCVLVSGLLLGAAAVVVLAQEGSEEKKMDIVDTAVKAGDFKTLAEALKKADLIETLKGEGPFTVFAPTDAAWEKMDADAREKLLNPEGEAGKERLSNLLTYHVSPGKHMAAAIMEMKTIGTLQGKDAPIKVEGEKVMVGGATVIKADIECSNGVIHVIDTVNRPMLH